MDSVVDEAIVGVAGQAPNLPIRVLRGVAPRGFDAAHLRLQRVTSLLQAVARHHATVDPNAPVAAQAGTV